MERETLKSRLGFILLSAGCAIGIGNVWKFPYIAGQGGGGAFVLFYLIFLVILGLPIMTMEFAVGRASRKSPVRAYQALEKPGQKWHIHGYFTLIGCYLLMMFYTTVAGWMLHYFYMTAVGKLAGLNAEQVAGKFTEMLASPATMTFWMVFVVVVSILVCAKGLQSGLERVTKGMMIALLLIMVVLAVNSLFMPGAKEGLSFFLVPDFAGEWCAILPRVWRDRNEPQLRTWLAHAKKLGVTSALAGNIGHLPLLRDAGLTIRGDFGLNVFNSRSLDYLRRKELSSACLSFELRFPQMRDIQKLIPAEAIVYGRLPLMITENCLVQNETGCHLSEAGDAVPQQAPCRKPNDLQDRTGAKFPLLPAYGHRTEIQNSAPVWLADKPEWKHCGLTYARLRFTTEAPAECADIFRVYQTGAPASGPFTRGLYYRGVD